MPTVEIDRDDALFAAECVFEFADRITDSAMRLGRGKLFVALMDDAKRARARGEAILDAANEEKN